MTILQDKFIEHYVLTGNATQSAIHAGYSEKTAKVKGSQLKAQFSNEIREATQKLLADKVPAGLRLSMFELTTMDWAVDGIVGPWE